MNLTKFLQDVQKSLPITLLKSKLQSHDLWPQSDDDCGQRLLGASLPNLYMMYSQINAI